MMVRDPILPWQRGGAVGGDDQQQVGKAAASECRGQKVMQQQGLEGQQVM